MPNPYFQFKQFTVYHDRCAMKVTTDACLFGAWSAEAIKNEKLKIKNCLDIGTGTGLLSLMIAQQNKVMIDAVEIDKEAADQAVDNVMRSPFAGITILNTDVLDFEPAKQYDVIICNPPFYEDDLQSGDEQKNTAHHSSRLKLNDLLGKITELLFPDGTFFLLMPFKRKAEIEKALELHGLYVWQELTVCQTETHSPFRWMIQGGKKPASTTKQEKIIIKMNGEYSSEFTALLQPYYLYL